MRTNRYALLTLIMIFSITSTVNAKSDNPRYNKALADSLGADEYGMKMYVLVILKTGTVNIADKAITDSLFAGHMKNIQRLASEGNCRLPDHFKKMTGITGEYLY